MATFPVKWFQSTMENAPSLTENFGDTVAVLDACLIYGFNLKPIASLTSAAGIATINITNGHKYLVDQIVTLSGFDQAAYNGEFRVLTATPNTLTVAISGTPASPGTGSSPQIKTSPVGGWEIAFTATNKRVYRSTDPDSAKVCLRVDNTAPSAYVSGRIVTAKVSMGSAMSDVDTYVDPNNSHPHRADGLTDFPDFGWHQWLQSYWADASGYGAMRNNRNAAAAGAQYSQRPWGLVADSRLFYYSMQMLGDQWYTVAFGEPIAYKPGDQFATFLWALDNYNGNLDTASYNLEMPLNGPFPSNFNGLIPAGQGFLKSYVGIGPATGMGKMGLFIYQSNPINDSAYDTGVAALNPADNSIIIHPSYCNESGGVIRGQMPGLFHVLTTSTNYLNPNSRISNLAGYPGRTFMVRPTSSHRGQAQTRADLWGISKILFDLTGPWR